jgi:hypothetical protein
LASTFPTTLDAIATNKADGTTTANDHAAHHNLMASAINAMQEWTQRKGPWLVVAGSDAGTTVLASADYECDGTNDNVELQAAIDAITAAGGGTVYVAGTLTLGAKVTMSSTNVPVWLEGYGVTSKITAKNSLNDDLLFIGDADTMGAQVLGGVRNLQVDGNGSNQSSGSCIRIQSGNRVSIIDCLVTDAKQHGIYIEGVSGSYRSDYALVQGCWVYLNLGHGVFCESEASTMSLIGNWISDNGAVGSAYDNVNFTNIGEGLICSNHIWQGKRHNIMLTGGGGPTIIVGNTLNTPQRSNIVNSANTGMVCSGNSFQDCSAETSGTYPHISLDCSGAIITGNWFNDTGATTPSDVLTESGSANHTLFESNVIDAGAGVRTITKIGAASIVRNNVGYTTEANGTATVANGATTVVVTHGLSVTPAAKNVYVTPTNSMGNATKFYVSTFTSTQFTITVNTDPGATTATFAWQAVVL